MYHVFHRTWWKENKSWPDGLEPQPGPKHTLARVNSEETALQICIDYNQNNDPGRLSDRAEYERA